MIEDNRSHKILTFLAVISLVALISGATYAYFAVGTTNNFGTSTINATADSIGSVALNGNSAQLNMDLTAVDMMQQTNSITYYASSDNKTTTPTEEVIAVASVSPTTDTNYYHCEYTLSISHTGTNDMYDLFNHQTNNTYDYTNRSTGQIILTVNGVDYDWASTNGMPSTIDGEFYIQGTDEVEITAGLRFINLNDTNQNYLAGTDISITIALQQDSFTCSAENEPSAADTLIALQPTNSTKIIKYNNSGNHDKVTDRYQDFGTGVEATNVYYFTSNDINNMIFANFCWKIVRTTEYGGVKLLYNGSPTNNNGNLECVAENGVNAQLSSTVTYTVDGLKDSPAYAGYMYNKTTGTIREMLYGVTEEEVTSEIYGEGVYTEATNVNTNSSLLKQTLETWFTANLNSISNKLDNAVYCNDRTLAANSPYSNLDTVYTSSLGTLYFNDGNQRETLECPRQTDAFSIDNPKAQISKNVGFLTEAERYLVGATALKSGQVYWLGSPNRFPGSTGVRTVKADGTRGTSMTNVANGVRPVITINSNVHIIDGNGSTSSPFTAE